MIAPGGLSFPLSAKPRDYTVKTKSNAEQTCNISLGRREPRSLKRNNSVSYICAMSLIQDGDTNHKPDYAGDQTCPSRLR